MVDVAYKLQLHYNIYRLVFPIWMAMVKIMKVKIPLSSCKLYAKKTYHEN